MRTVPVMGNGGMSNGGHHPDNNGHVANGSKGEKVLLTGYDLKVQLFKIKNIFVKTFSSHN
jgi:hypothetical protein